MTRSEAARTTKLYYIVGLRKHCLTCEEPSISATYLESPAYKNSCHVRDRLSSVCTITSQARHHTSRGDLDRALFSPKATMEATADMLRNGNSTTALVDASAKTGHRGWSTLPTEIWLEIVGYLLSGLPLQHQTFPNPITYQYSSQDVSNSQNFLTKPLNGDLFSLASTCRLLAQLVRPLLYGTVMLPSRWHLEKFASVIRPKQRQNWRIEPWEQASWIRVLHLKLEKPQNPRKSGWRHKHCGCSLCDLLCHAANVHMLSIDTVSQSHVLTHLLNHVISCRPYVLTLRQPSEPLCLTGSESFYPLSRLTRLHLIQVVPPPELVSLLVGRPVSAQCHKNIADAMRKGQSPNRTLECLRLSQLPWDALDDFEAYVTLRKDWDDFDQLPADERARRSPPPSLGTSSSKEQAQRALYDLAVNSDNMPRFKLLVLELGLPPHLPLPSQMAYVVRETLRLRKHPSVRPRAERELGNQATSSDSPWFHSETRRAARGGFTESDSNPSALPGGATSWAWLWDEYDEDWHRIESGKETLVRLWERSRSNATVNHPIDEASTSIRTEIRVVVPRHRQSDRTMRLQDFLYHMEAAMPLHVEHRQSRQSALGAGLEENQDWAAAVRGTWTDPDVFSLVEEMPWLSHYRPPWSYRCYWTGFLPRISDLGANGRSIVIPRIVRLHRAALDDEGEQELMELQKRRGVHILNDGNADEEGDEKFEDDSDSDDTEVDFDDSDSDDTEGDFEDSDEEEEDFDLWEFEQLLEEIGTNYMRQGPFRRRH